VLSGGTQEVVRLELIAPAGRWYEPSLGVSHFTASQLDKGTASKSSYQVASLFDDYGAHLEITPGNDFITITVYALTKNVRDVVAVLLEIVTDAIFPEQELVLGKSIFLQNLKVNEEKTSYVAGKLFRKEIFGEHPYGREVDVAAVEGIDRNALVKYHLQQLGNFQAIVSGNVSDSLTKQLAQLLGQLPTKEASFNHQTYAKINSKNRYVPKEGSVQSTIRYGKRTINRQHEDFFDLIFLTHILGGYFGSRLMKNVREEKGLTYGIHASVQPLLRDAFFVIGADVNRENRELTVQEIQNELKKLMDEPVPKNELEAARNHFIGSLQSEVTNAFAHSDKFKTILLNQLPQDYYQQMINRIDVLTAKDLQRIAEKYFTPSSFIEVSVG
jgi:predicted Zn-dependent peptidase